MVEEDRYDDRQFLEGRQPQFNIVINYYGEKGFKLLQKFSIDYYNLFEKMEVLTLDVKTETFYEYKNIQDLINHFSS